MKKSKLITSVLIFVLVSLMAMSVQAITSGTVDTSEFGTFSYYINANGNGIGASTTITS